MNKFFKGIGFYLVIFIIIVGIVQFSGKPTQKVETLEFSKVYRELTNENISRLYFVSDTAVEGTIKDSNTKFRSYVPKEIMGDTLSKEVLDQAKEGKIVFGGEAKPSTPWFVELLPTLLLIFFMVILWFVFMNQSQGGGGRVMNFGKSKAKVHKDDEKTRVTFKEVAGLNEEKEDLQEVVDFLKNPKKYIELGARIPKGILMVGPPGTGKTYLSRAVAGEAGVPFFSISGSDFVEMFVGVGASRVRDLFEQAKKNAPAIIFIDEIDAVGRKRGAGLGGGHDEREQTLNQLLVEMDGFGVNQGIIIMAATNRPDILDPALLRPGRFDRQIVVGAPDVKGREAIFKVHSKNKPLADDVNIEVLARRTPGFTPADIENLMNEAAILTARKREKKIHMETIEEAITKVIAGVAKKSRVISEPERKLTAYHEAGHAVCAHVLPHVSPVHQVTIVPRGRAGGFTMQLPVEDKFYATKNEMKENTELISVTAANCQTGTSEPFTGIGTMTSEKGVIFHTDAAFAFGKMPINVERSHIDLLTADASYFGGPENAGFLYVRKSTGAGEYVSETALSEETLTVMSDMAESLAAKATTFMEEIRPVRNHMCERIFAEIEDVELNGHKDHHLTNHLNIRIKNVSAAVVQKALKEEGIEAGIGTNSNILAAIGRSKAESAESVSFSLKAGTTMEDVDKIVDNLKEIVTGERTIL